MYEVIDTHTRSIVAKRKTSRSAHREADKRDLAYGAIKHVVRRAHQEQAPQPEAQQWFERAAA